MACRDSGWVKDVVPRGSSEKMSGHIMSTRLETMY